MPSQAKINFLKLKLMAYIDTFDNFKDTLAIPKSVKTSPGFTKMRSQNSEIMFPVVMT